MILRYSRKGRLPKVSSISFGLQAQWNYSNLSYLKKWCKTEQPKAGPGWQRTQLGPGPASHCPPVPLDLPLELGQCKPTHSQWPWWCREASAHLCASLSPLRMAQKCLIAPLQHSHWGTRDLCQPVPPQDCIPNLSTGRLKWDQSNLCVRLQPQKFRIGTARVWIVFYANVCFIADVFYCNRVGISINRHSKSSHRKGLKCFNSADL